VKVAQDQTKRRKARLPVKAADSVAKRLAAQIVRAGPVPDCAERLFWQAFLARTFADAMVPRFAEEARAYIRSAVFTLDIARLGVSPTWARERVRDALHIIDEDRENDRQDRTDDEAGRPDCRSERPPRRARHPRRSGRARH